MVDVLLERYRDVLRRGTILVDEANEASKPRVLFSIESDITDGRQTGAVAGWRLADGTRRLLAGNLEEGFRDDADRSRTLGLRLPPDWRGCDAAGERQGSVTVRSRDRIDLILKPQGSLLLRCRAQ